METNVFSFSCGAGGNWADQVSWPGSGSQNVPSDGFVSYDGCVLADSTLTPQPGHHTWHPTLQPGSAWQGGPDITKAFEGDMS